ncbi:MAG TPA: DUF1844 domain-containing protein [Tepidisphaeraceae bacterium]|jgi:hypothetical protein
MAEEKSSLHIDLDWKKQAQEEKRRLEEEEKRRADERAAASQSAAVTPAGVVPATAAPMAGVPAGAAAAAAGTRTGGRARAGARGERELPAAGIPSLAQSLVTQTLFYLSDMGGRAGGDEMSNMDMAKHLIDTLGVLEEKTKNNLTPEEQQFLDTALYEARMRFISVAGQVIAGG